MSAKSSWEYMGSQLLAVGAAVLVSGVLGKGRDMPKREGLWFGVVRHFRPNAWFSKRVRVTLNDGDTVVQAESIREWPVSTLENRVSDLKDRMVARHLALKNATEGQSGAFLVRRGR